MLDTVAVCMLPHVSVTHYASVSCIGYTIRGLHFACEVCCLPYRPEERSFQCLWGVFRVVLSPNAATGECECATDTRRGVSLVCHFAGPCSALSVYEQRKLMQIPFGCLVEAEVAVRSLWQCALQPPEHDGVATYCEKYLTSAKLSILDVTVIKIYSGLTLTSTYSSD